MMVFGKIGCQVLSVQCISIGEVFARNVVTFVAIQLARTGKQRVVSAHVQAVSEIRSLLLRSKLIGD